MKPFITLTALTALSTLLPTTLNAEGKQVSESGIRHSFLVCGKLTALIDEDSKVVWQVPGYGRDGMVLENGNVLVTIGNQSREYKKGSDEIVWSYTLDKRNKELGTSNRLPNGNTLIVERGPLPRVLEVAKDGAIAVEVPLKPDTDNGHMQTRMARKLPNGNYIAPHLLGFAIKEYSPTGEVVRTIKTDLEELGGRAAKNWPFTAILLPNKNILANLTNGNKTVEFDPEGKVVWRVDNTTNPGLFADPCGGQRLPNGNTVICSYGQRDAAKAKIFEVTADKKVVWEYIDPKVGAHEVHILTTNGKAVKPALR